MEKHDDFTKWAHSKGVKRYGIACHKFEGKGMGIVAEKTIENGNVILTVPTSALRTVHTVPKHISQGLGTISVHGLLATDLSLDTTEARAPWRAVLPTIEDFASMPFLWSSSAQEELTSRTKAMLENQKRKYAKDWSTVHAAFPSIPEATFRYSWLIVNTRTFYYVRPGAQTPKSSDDCMALNPFADYFNHASRGCSAIYNQRGFTFYADKRYEKGDEVFISYGNHSNDFLLVEYGFVLADNDWDVKV